MSIINAFNIHNAPERIQRLYRNLRRNGDNNYRKLHKLPMRRWVQLYKVKEE